MGKSGPPHHPFESNHADGAALVITGRDFSSESKGIPKIADLGRQMSKTAFASAKRSDANTLRRYALA